MIGWRIVCVGLVASRPCELQPSRLCAVLCLFRLRRRGEGGVAFADLFVFVWIVVSSYYSQRWVMMDNNAHSGKLGYKLNFVVRLELIRCLSTSRDSLLPSSAPT